jgi:molybdopterin/thiamine biosynthesis adenylyltransferase
MPEYNIYPILFQKNIGAVTLEEQELLRNSSVAVIGCGGIGGIAFELLVRSGIGKITVVDGDVFDISNINRQTLCNYKNIGKKKAAEAERFAKSINAEIEITAIGKNLDEKNAKQILKGNNAVVDGLDNGFARVIVSRTAKELKVPYIFGACERTRGYTTVFSPSGITYEDVFSLPSEGKRITPELKEQLAASQRCDSVLGAVSNLIGSLEAMQTICVLLGKEFVGAPQFIHVDAFGTNKLRIDKL